MSEIQTKCNLPHTDTLTGLHSRQSIIKTIDGYIAQYRNTNSVFSIAILDVDNIRNINDTYGHSKGDQILQEIGRTIQNNIRDCDQAGRYGGDEFILVFPGKTIAQIECAIGRVLKALHGIEIHDGINLSVSLGLTEYKDDELEDMLNIVDEYLQLAKNNSKKKKLYTRTSA